MFKPIGAQDRKGTTTRRRKSTRILVPCALLTCVLFCSFCVCDLFADRIVLKEGQTLTGDILAEKETQLYLDIGLTVLTIPKEKILEYEYTAAFEDEDIDVNDTNVGRRTAITTCFFF